MNETRKKVFNIGVIKVTRKYDDGTITTYNEVVTTPSLGEKTWDFLGHHFSDRIDDIVEHVEKKRK